MFWLQNSTAYWKRQKNKIQNIKNVLYITIVLSQDQRVHAAESKDI